MRCGPLHCKGQSRRGVRHARLRVGAGRRSARFRRGSAWTTRVRAEARFRRGMRAGSNGRRGQARRALKGNFAGAGRGTPEGLSRRGASRLRRVRPQLRRSASTRAKSSLPSGDRVPLRTPCTSEIELERIAVRRRVGRGYGDRKGGSGTGAVTGWNWSVDAYEWRPRRSASGSGLEGSAPLNLKLHGRQSGESTRRAPREGRE